MTVFEVGIWVVKPEKQAEFTKLWKRFLKYLKENPKMFKELKSIKLFTQTLGGITGAYVELAEYDSLADYEKLNKRTLKDAGYMKLFQEFMLIIDPATLTSSVMNFVM